MTQPKCSSCGKDALTYLIELDGVKIYLCFEHFPANDLWPSGVQRRPPIRRKPYEQCP
jgi:hypothetical protein